MPDLGGSSKHREKPNYRAYKRKLYHDVIYAMLESVREAQANGGFECFFQGKFTII